MIIIPLAQNASFCVIEPGNITELKKGRPLRVGEHMVVFTPDANAFLRELGVQASMPGRDEMNIHEVRLTPEKIQEALDKCKDLPEVDRA